MSVFGVQAGVTNLMLNERMINVPIQLVPALHSSLKDDVAWATRNTSGEEAKDYAFSQILLVTTCHMEQGAAAQALSGECAGDAGAKGCSSSMKKKKKKKKGKRRRVVGGGDDNSGNTKKYFTKFEDEIFLQYSEWAVPFQLPKKDAECKASDGGVLKNDPFSHLREVGLAMLLPVDQWATIVARVDSLVKASL